MSSLLHFLGMELFIILLPSKSFWGKSSTGKTFYFYFIVLLFLSLTLIGVAGCDTEKEKDVRIPSVDEVDGTFMTARTGEKYFRVFDDDGWDSFYINGINIGTALPGRWYTQFPSDRELYRSWLEQISAMNMNVIRIYTLLDPSFYQVFSEFNSDPDNPRLWLMQEIWPHDEVPELNFYDDDYVATYKKEVDLVIDALHGNADILPRSFRAYGSYTADVSPYVLGILIGRELEPEEVEATNEANPGKTAHSGEYVKTEGASATEVWLADLCDYTMEYAQDTYSWQYPVGFVSWPTLDPLTHYTEWDEDGKPGYNDREEVRPDIFAKGEKNKAGFFGAYHIYPNYPDLMNNEPGFADFSDEEGSFRYLGYLNNFIDIHPPYPAVVAEFGMSTSLNTAHLNPDGFHHGMVCEVDQGEMVVRMMKGIFDKGYAGSIIFEWSDEWAKKTWNTEPYMIPWERQNLWKNAMDPEQNYGILSYEPAHIPFSGREKQWLENGAGDTYSPPAGKDAGFARIESLYLDSDEAFLYLTLKVEGVNLGNIDNIPWDDFGIMAGIDTADRKSGDFLLPADGLPELPTGCEFLLYIASPDDAGLLVVPSYNRAELKFKPESSKEGVFTRIEPIVNRERDTTVAFIPALYSDESELRYGFFDPEHEEYSSLSHWYVDEEAERIIIRLPWMLLNVSDPSEATVISDSGTYLAPPLRDELSTTDTEGFLFYAVTVSGKIEDYRLSEGTPQPLPVIDFQPRLGNIFDLREPYLWPLWEEPVYRARLKKSYPIIAEFSKELSKMDLN